MAPEKEESKQVFPELIFGLVGAIGTDLDQVQDALAECLRAVGYEPILISLAESLKELKRQGDPDFPIIPEKTSSEYYDQAIKRGNYFRQSMEQEEAALSLGIQAIQLDRDSRKLESKRRAYVLRSLKRKEEVELLRSIYGPAAIIISVYSPRSERVNRLSEKLATISHRNRLDSYRTEAEALVQRDEEEHDVEYGQRVRKTFPLADFFVEIGTGIKTQESLERFIELVFGNLSHTPSLDEQGMAMAHLARLRSGSPARQVGAAIADLKGRILSIGTNEVPKAGGGQYWPGDTEDGRDYAYGAFDVSDKMRKNLLGDLLERIGKAKLLVKNCPSLDELLARKPSEKSSESIRESLIFDTIDFIRVVHAEASALFNLRIPATEPGMTLYVTTFPCHECARHIVISGIKRVMYIEPYPKSLVRELYHDSISIDEQCEGPKVSFLPFVGIAPNLYTRLFEVGERKRKNDDGKIIKWNPRSSFPQLLRAYSETAARVSEEEKLKVFRNRLKEKGYS